MKMVGRIPYVLADDLGNLMFVAAFPAKKELDTFYKDVLKLKPAKQKKASVPGQGNTQ